MEAIGMILLVVGYIVMAVGGIWLLITAFQESILWGLGCLFVPFVSLIFIIMHWNVARKPFLVWLGGLVPVLAGVALAGKQ